MNAYARQAMAHWKRWKPVSYAQLTKPQEYFSQLGELAEQQIDEIRDQILASRPPADPTSSWVKTQEWNTATAQARETVIRELILVDPDPQMTQDELPDPNYQPILSVQDVTVGLSSEDDEE